MKSLFKNKQKNVLLVITVKCRKGIMINTGTYSLHFSIHKIVILIFIKKKY